MQPKILLVDDREDGLLSIEAILEPSGYVCIKANSGRQALKILMTEFDFALILMDVRMPNLDGFETAALIYERERLQHIPIIFITANPNEGDNIFKAYQSGAIDYIFKPINPDVLRAKVGVLIDLYKKNRLLIKQEQKLITVNKNLEREISERKNSEEEVIQLNRQLLKNIAILESSNRDLERFTFVASHDLQEPLRKIRLFSNMLKVKYRDVFREDIKLISRIYQNAERMQMLITDIFAFSRTTTDKLVFEECNLNTLLKELLDDMDEEVKECKATIIMEMIPPLSVIPRLMRPLFQNLISNALKFRRKNRETIIRIHSEISLAISDSDNLELVNKYCRIFVEDNGIGFDPKYSEEIFGMLKRLHDNSEYEGTGIGLALCRRIAELNNGFISARCNANEGSTFIVSLPLKQEEAA